MTSTVSDTEASTPPKPIPATLKTILLALAIGTAGGTLFNALGLPLPWMLGAMAANTVAAVSGLQVQMSKYLRTVMIAVLGVLLGSAFTPDMLEHVGRWTVSLSVLTIFLVILALMVSGALTRFAGYDTPTAFFSSLPAGLTEMTVIGVDNGGDGRTIALTHTIRILLVAFAVPFSMTIFAGYERPTTTGPAIGDLDVNDIAILAACGIVGLFIGLRFKLPAGPLAGPLAFSAAVHLAGLTSSSPPATLVSIAQVVLGTTVGVRFAGLTLAHARKAIVFAVLATAIMLALSAFCAFVLGPLIGVSPTAFFLALAPGGVTEMSLMALALNQDVAFVTTHHILRIALVVFIGPVAFAAFQRWRARAATSETQE